MPATTHFRRVLYRQRAQLARCFFARFFHLLAIAVSAAQAVILWWVWPGTLRTGGASTWVLAAGAIYAANRGIMRRTQRQRQQHRRRSTLTRLYYASALICLFCASYLFVLTIFWIPVAVFVEALTVQAWLTPTGLLADSGANPIFAGLANVGMAAITLTFAYGYTVGQQRLRINQIVLGLRNFSSGHDGVRIVHISDIHLGDNLKRQELERFVEQVNLLQPHLVCITGDIVDAPDADVDTLLPVLARVRATHGVFAVLGNHDHYAGADQVRDKLRQHTGMTVLRDAHTSIVLNGQRLHIVGLDDRGRDWARGVPAAAYLGTALATIPADEPVVLLCHRPDIFTQAAAGGVALTLSGHTHGGQLGFPWPRGRVRNLAEFITAFDRGLFERDGSYLYVSCGLGVTGQRIRLCTPREITLIEGRGADAGAARPPA